MANKGCNVFQWLIEGFTKVIKANAGVEGNLNGNLTKTGTIDVAGKLKLASNKDIELQGNGKIDGPVSGDITGDLVKTDTITVKGAMTLDADKDITLQGTGKLNGPVTGDVTGDLKKTGTIAVHGAMTFEEDKDITLQGTGKVNGPLTGAVTGAASTNTAQGNALIDFLSDGILSAPGLKIDSGGPTPEKFEIDDAFAHRINKIVRVKDAAAELTFSDAHVVSSTGGNKWGAILIQVNAAGAVSTVVESADQSFDTRAEAVAALPDAAAENVAIGYIVIQTKDGVSWTANTDDMTDGSDVETAEFIDGAVNALPAPIA